MLRDLLLRVEAATPPGRDRTIDALRAVAILGVVFGHWLVTGLVADSGTLHTASPLRYLPDLVPLSWLLQTLALFFLVGGYVAERSWRSGRPYGPWLRSRLGRLYGPVAAVLVVWTVAAVGMLASGVGAPTVRTLLVLALSPLWFLLVFTALTAATPWLARLRPWWPLAVVLSVDLLRFGFGGPGWLGWLNLAAGWLVPYCLGAAWARGELDDRTTGWVLLLGGTVTTVGLVVWAGYPAAMVGVPGAEVSNLNPPTLAAVSFGIAQCGAARLLLEPLRRLMARPGPWTVVALVNRSAMTIYLWHQTALLAVTAVGLLASSGLGGLHTLPDGSGWILARLAWLPAFAVALLVCWAAFASYERRALR